MYLGISEWFLKRYMLRGLRLGHLCRLRVRLVPDQKGIESFWLLGLHGNVRHDSESRSAPGPVEQLANVVSWSLEGRLDAAVGKVADPSAHALPEGHLPAGGAEVDALDLTGDQHPIADHNQTVRHGRQRRGTGRRREGGINGCAGTCMPSPERFP